MSFLAQNLADARALRRTARTLRLLREIALNLIAPGVEDFRAGC